MDDVRLYKRYLLYLIRWQLSTPILYFALAFLPIEDYFAKTIIANLIGGLIFFWIDKKIFKEGAIQHGNFK